MSLKHLYFFLFISILINNILLSGCISQVEYVNKPWNIEYDITYPIEIIYIIDGDTIKASYKNESIMTIRFLGIDTPELIKDKNHAFEYGSISNLSCLTSFGVIAKNMTQSLFKNKTGYIIFDENAGLKDQYDRYLCYVFTDMMIDVQKKLLESGYARVYISEDFTKKQEYIMIQQQAKKNNKGLWICE